MRPSKMSKGELDFLNSMEEAYKDRYGCDVDVHVGDRKFKASKWMLRANSSVFRAMFSGETKENQTNSVTINEFDVDIVEPFLCYLHTGKLSDLCADQIELFPIADYYDVKGLRELCLEAMFSSLDRNSVRERFKMAEKFSLADLKTKALNVMTEDLKSETFYSYLEFARSNKSEELEACVIKFIEDNMCGLCKQSDWKKLDPELRLKLLESRLEMDSGLMLEVDCSDITMHTGNAYEKTIVLKNTGSTRLVYKISPVSADQHFYAGPQSEFIKPGQSRSVDIEYDRPQMIINYQAATTEANIGQCFQQNSFCRQLVPKLT